ncbi:MAG: TIGR02186 family protein [Hyphomicrobiales bacterium]|nr:TIGR02186 family protein [Hyphomicrobiales bacterium]
MRRVIVILATALSLIAATAANAQRTPPEGLQTDLSSHEVLIETNFSGVRVIIFGAVDNSRQPSADSGLYDVVVTLRGPDETIVARRKERVAGLWVNNRAMAFRDAPSFYAVLSTRPLADIAPPPVLRKYGLGFESLALIPAHSENGYDGEDFALFRDAVIQLKREQKLYVEAPSGVDFVGRSLFRGAFDLPANVPTGEFTADIFLFSGGRLLSVDETRVTIGKAGFGQFVHATAVGSPLLYGVGAVVIAVISGLIASAMFRKY